MNHIGFSQNYFSFTIDCVLVIVQRIGKVLIKHTRNLKHDDLRLSCFFDINYGGFNLNQSCKNKDVLPKMPHLGLEQVILLCSLSSIVR